MRNDAIFNEKPRVQIACFSLPRIVLFSSAPSLRCTLQFISVLSDLGKFHRVSCLQSPPVIFHSAVSGIISNSILLKNLDKFRLFCLSYSNATIKGFFYLSPAPLQLLHTTLFPHLASLPSSAKSNS